MSTLDAASSPPVGMFEDTEYTTARARLAAGDTLFFFTDGFIEAPSPSGELLGEERLDRCILQAESRAATLLSRAVTFTERHLAGATASDDMTALAITYRG